MRGMRFEAPIAALEVRLDMQGYNWQLEQSEKPPGAAQNSGQVNAT